jgi:hydrophobic/amphiphilic exporter-1 (mainly G- bacteria), HAE1 family
MSIAQKVVGRPVLIVVMFALVLIVALYSLSSISLALIPDVTMPMVMVNTTYTGASPEVVEKTVTKTLESALAKVQGVIKLTSTSSDGSSAIMLKFNYGKDIDKAANDIRDKIDTVRDALPSEANSPTVMKLDPNSMPIMKIAIKGNRTAEQLKKIGEDTIESQLEQTEGVSTATVTGGRTEIVRVDASQSRLQAYGLTLQSIAATLSAQNIELGGGKITEGTTEYSVRTTGAFSDVTNDISNATIATKNGVMIRLKDVATVFDGYADPDTTVYINGEPGVYISVMKQTGSNTVTVASGIYKKIKALQEILPNDIKLEIVDDSSTQVRSTVYDLIKAIVEGAILTMIFVFLFLRSFKSTIIIALAMPISVLATLLSLYFAGMSLNMMTMAGLLISIGNIVDSSIVILDNTFKYRERGTKPTIAAILGTQEMMVAISAGILASLSVFVPIVLFSDKLGMMGIMFKPMIFTIIISHIVSWFVAVFLVPVLASHYLPLTTRAEKPLKNPVMIAIDRGIGGAIDALTKAYRTALVAALKHRLVTIATVVVIIVVSVMYLMPKLTIVFSPQMSSSSVTLSIEMPLGTTFKTTETVVTNFASIAKKELKNISNVIGTTGSSGGFSSTTSSNKGSVTVTLPDGQFSIENYTAIQNTLRAHFAEYPSAIFSFSSGNRLQENSDIDITLSSTNYTGLSKTGKEILALIKANLPEVLEPTSDSEDGLPQVEIAIDRQRAYSFGISVSTIATEIRDAIKGYAVTTYQKGGDELDVTVRFQESDRQQIVDLNRIFVLGSSGQKVALSSIATLKKGVGPVQIHRTSQQRSIEITGSLAKGKQANVVEDKIKSLIKSKLTIPSDVYVRYSGSWAEVTEMAGVFGIIIILALLLVFCVMAGQYESFKDPLINMFTIPLMLIGVLAAYVLKGQNLSMFTMVGIVMLIGIVVNNGILLVDYTNLLRGRGVPLMEACIQGGSSRFRPVVMTAGATILGAVPMAFFDSGSSSMTQPIGLAIVGGLTSATFITLLLIPVVYYLVNKRQARKENAL